MKQAIIFFSALLTISCSQKSVLQQNRYIPQIGDKLKTNGIYYGKSNYFDTRTKRNTEGYFYLKFFKNGLFMGGSLGSLDELNSLSNNSFDTSHLKKTQYKSYYIIFNNDTIYSELYNGYSKSYYYEVDKIIDENKIEILGNANKLGGKLSDPAHEKKYIVFMKME